MNNAPDNFSGRKWTLPATAILMVITLVGCDVVANSPIGRIGGPPEVTMEESYAENPDGPKFDHSAFDGLLKRLRRRRRSGGLSRADRREGRS